MAQTIKNLIRNRETHWGWTIKTVDDLVLAALGTDAFATVCDVESFIADTLTYCIQRGIYFRTVDDFINYCEKLYI